MSSPAAVVVVGAALGDAVVTALPAVLLAAKIVPVARVGQTLAHLSSGGSLAVTARFSFFFVQVAAFAVMAASFASVLL